MKARYPGFEIAVYIFFTFLVLATSGFPFFWDTVQLASKHAHFFYETNFATIILPNEIDSGHIPTLGIYIALVWKIFGKSLFISHLAMLPFVLGLVYQALHLVKHRFPARWQPFAIVILLSDPTLLAQSTLVSPDVLLVFFFLMALNSMSGKNRMLYIISLAGLTLSSMRGMMCAGGLFASEVIIVIIKSKSDGSDKKAAVAIRSALSLFVAYVPALLIAALFFGWHFYKTGWIGYHKDMPWYPMFEYVDLRGAIRNIFILGWRMIDFGRLFVWITALYCFRNYFRRRPSLPVEFKPLIVISIILFLSLAHAAILHRNLSGHRYFLPVYIAFTLSVLYYLFEISGEGMPKKFFAWLMIIGLLSGNFWVYPDRIAKGWDSTLAYIPYFHLRKEMMHYMSEKGIKLGETGTCFPNTEKLELIDLNGENDAFAAKNLSSDKYIFYSNIYNDFSDKELWELKHNWIKIRELRLLQVKVILYQNPSLPSL